MATETKVCSKCKEELPHSMFYQRVANRDNLTGQCKRCFENAWGRESWEMLKVAPRYQCNCVFRPECINNIKVGRKDWQPYCFVQAPYHGLYVKEYA